MFMNNLPCLDRFGELLQNANILRYFPTTLGSKEKFICSITKDHTNLDFCFGDVRVSFQFPNDGESARFRFLVEAAEVKHRYLYFTHEASIRTMDEILVSELERFKEEGYALNPHLDNYLKKHRREILS